MQVSLLSCSLLPVRSGLNGPFIFNCWPFLIILTERGENTIGKLNRWVILKSNFEVSGLVFSCIETKFARKYSLDSSRRDLHNARLCTVL